MQAAIEIILALLPFAVLIAGFLVFRLGALQTSLAAWVVEFAVIFGYYHMGILRSVESALWGALTMWTGFLVVYTGMIFGQAYRSTGLLRVLLDSVESLIPARDKEGRAIALMAIVGGFIGAFNGFATYPVTIPGLVELGFNGVQAIAGYLVYFAWSVPFCSMFIGANIANAATQLPIADIAAASGLFGIPLVFISLGGSLKILGFRFFARETQVLFWLLGIGNSLGIIVFCLIWPAYYILTLIAGSAFSLVLLYGYGLYAKRATVGAAVAQPLSAAVSFPAAAPVASPAGAWRAYAPLVLGAAYVVAMMMPSVASAVSHSQFRVTAWGYAPISINLITSAGFIILVTAAFCYLFRCKSAPEANAASHRWLRSSSAVRWSIRWSTPVRSQCSAVRSRTAAASPMRVCCRSLPFSVACRSAKAFPRTSSSRTCRFRSRRLSASRWCSWSASSTSSPWGRPIRSSQR